MPAQLTTIPLNLVEPHPKLAFRFAYDVKGLADSIRAAADENTPNGQLNPGRVVLKPDGKGYYVYVGVRRYKALKLLYETTKDERFGSYTAYVDTGMNELQMFIKAKRENDEEQGERQGLSVLEELFGITLIREAISPEGIKDHWLKRLIDVAVKLDENKLRRLYEIEAATHAKFRLPHLEYLCKIGSEDDLILTAATAAAFNYAGSDMERAWEDRSSVLSLDWFRRNFPEIKKAEPSGNGGSSQQNSVKKKSKSKAKKNTVKGMEVHEKEVILVPCPRCGRLHMVETKGKIEATHVPEDPDGESRTEVAASVSRMERACSKCGGRFFAFVEHLEGRKYAAESSVSMRFKEPKKVAEAVDLRFDRKEDVWQIIAGDKVVGPLDFNGEARK
ncbi:MAG: ParB/RepB/Spo0J family partition protein [Thaumarchaeota archaeon]|nr:ParB/RepB/Spo0J family partition protein [Nitrososphaerota archaeon]